MNKSIYILILSVFLLACSEEAFFPKGLYGYQVEHLLTGGDMKHWMVQRLSVDGQNQSVNACSDTLIWVFDEAGTDSVSVYELRYDAGCVLYDTTWQGKLSVSGGDDYFHDSLYLIKNKRVVKTILVDHVTSLTLGFSYTTSNAKYSLDLTPAKSMDIPARQVLPLLGGEDGRDWKLTKLLRKSSNVSLTDCQDSTYLRFTPNGTNWKVERVDRDENCEDLSNTVLFGTITSVGFHDGIYFDSLLTLEGGSVDQIKVKALSQTALQISYDSLTATYKRR